MTCFLPSSKINIMQKLTSLLMVLFAANSFAQIPIPPQKPNYDIYGSFGRPIKDEVLKSPDNMDDLIPYYPHNWIVSHESTEITIKHNGETKSARGKNDTLTKEQIQLLKNTAIGDQITIIVNYKNKNSINGTPESSKMNVKYTVMPESEAQCSVDNKELRKYFDQSAIDKLPADFSKRNVSPILKFTVNENGEVSEAKITNPSGDEKVDKLLLDAVYHMPKWKPAQNSKGTKFKQEFIFRLNGSGC